MIRKTKIWSRFLVIKINEVPVLKNFFQMPFLLKFIVSAATMTPMVVLISLLLRPNLDQFDFNKLAIGFLGLCVALIWTSSYLFLKRERNSRIMWLVGWVLLCFSPLFPIVEGAVVDEYLDAQLFSQLIMGLLVGTYLFKSKTVSRYLEKAQVGEEWASTGEVSLWRAQLNYFVAFWISCKTRLNRLRQKHLEF